MSEISLSILDVVVNSIKAKSDFIKITVQLKTPALLTVIIEDNGCGMSPESVGKVTDPFYTTRTTRQVGLGIPFFQSAALMTGGSFDILSKEGKGTTITAVFHTDHIDCIPLGDITSTIYTLILTNEEIDFLYTYSKNEKSFTLDTRELRMILNHIPFHNKEVSTFLKNYLIENKTEVDN